MEDIAILTGGQVISEDYVLNLKMLNLMIWILQKIKVDKDNVPSLMVVVKNLISKLDVNYQNKLKKLLMIMTEKIKRTC